jgi:hypothetical protein
MRVRCARAKVVWEQRKKKEKDNAEAQRTLRLAEEERDGARRSVSGYGCQNRAERCEDFNIWNAE